MNQKYKLLNVELVTDNSDDQCDAFRSMWGSLRLAPINVGLAPINVGLAPINVGLAPINVGLAQARPN